MLRELEAKSPGRPHVAPAPTVANAKVQVRRAKARRGPSDRFIAALLVLLVLAGIGWAYLRAPVTQVEPLLDQDAVTAAAQKRTAMAALERGHALVLKGADKADEAIAAYREALRLDPSLAAAERGLGISFATKQAAKDAVRHYKRYLQLSPDAKDAGEVRRIIREFERRR